MDRKKFIITSSLAVFGLSTYADTAPPPRLLNCLAEFQASEFTLEKHFVKKRPQCPACGNPEAFRQHPPKINLSHDPSPTFDPENFRTIPPEATFGRISEHVDALTGIIPYLKEFHGQEGDPFKTYSSGLVLGIQPTTEAGLKHFTRTLNGGKGKNELVSKVGAICEGIERYSSFYRKPLYTEKGSLSSLKGAIHPNDCLLYSDWQYEHRDELNRQSNSLYELIPYRFDPECMTDWTPVYNLSRDHFNYLPTGLCYGNYPFEDKRAFAFSDSNGTAAGNTLEEAIFQGILELVERDAVAIWWYNRLSRPGVDLRDLNSDFLEQNNTYYQSQGRDFHLLDLTTDLGIPVYAAVSYDLKDTSTDRILFGFGSHLVPEIAVERATLEMNQLMPNLRKELTPNNSYLPLMNWLTTAKMSDHPYLRPSEAAPTQIGDHPGYSSLHPALSEAIQRIEKNGLEVLALDLTQPDINLPVAKVFIPGLRHWWKRTAPGRIYEVPVKMGWLKQTFAESALNPIGIFI